MRGLTIHKLAIDDTRWALSMEKDEEGGDPYPDEDLRPLQTQNPQAFAPLSDLLGAAHAHFEEEPERPLPERSDAVETAHADLSEPRTRLMAGNARRNAIGSAASQRVARRCPAGAEPPLEATARTACVELLRLGIRGRQRSCPRAKILSVRKYASGFGPAGRALATPAPDPRSASTHPVRAVAVDFHAHQSESG